MTSTVPVSMSLNTRAKALADDAIARADELRIAPANQREPTTIDCGATARGGIEAGLVLARICLAGLADVSIINSQLAGRPWPFVQVHTDHPVSACLASQYAGWQISAGKFFAMGSGPMRAAAGVEALFDRIGHRESPASVVGVLECRKPPTEEAIAKIAEACRVPAPSVTLLYAPTASTAGTLQVVARSVETAMHKLAELEFDLERIVSAIGIAPLPPVARDDLAAIGRTNDAILYGASVTLMVRGDDESLDAIVRAVPSSASRDHGAPFAEIFARYNNDFYAVDPHLFSPAHVVFQNLDTGNTHEHGKIEPSILARSFGLAGAVPQ